MEFRLLGPLEASDGDGSLPLGGPKQRTVLAHLLLRANRVVTTERLIDALWGEEPPDTARNTMQTYVRHLRRALGADRIAHRSAGTCWRPNRRAGPPPVRRDGGGRPPSDGADLPRLPATLREALDLWRGPALDDLAEQPSLQPDIARLEEIRMAALEDRVAADLALGRHRELVPELETLLGRHPFRERLWGSSWWRCTGRPPGRRPGRVPAGAGGAHRGAGDRSLARAAAAAGPDPSPGPGARRGGRAAARLPAARADRGRGRTASCGSASQPHGRPRGGDQGHRAGASPTTPSSSGGSRPRPRLVARLEHPHIVPLYDYWREPDGAYLVMRYLRGGNLRGPRGDGPARRRSPPAA